MILPTPTQTITITGTGFGTLSPFNGDSLYLKNDAGTAFLGPVTPGGVGSLSNCQCSVDVGATSVTRSDDALTLNLALSFTSAFAGTQGIFVYADDQNGQTTAGRQQRGTWIVP
jgi:hypothetical protein